MNASISLVIMDTDCHVLANEALQRSMKFIKFDEVMIYSDKTEPWGGLPVKKIEPFTKKGDYDNFMVNELHKDLTTQFVLVIQFDGFILSHLEWNNLFLRYDYIGAPWPKHNHGEHNVGNGGFSLRTKRLCEEVSTHNYNYFDGDIAEDVFICQKLRPTLEEKKFYFPHESIASHFSAESYVYRYPTFGFHNIRFLPLVYSDRLDFLIDNLSDRVLKSFGQLMLPNMKHVSETHAKKLQQKMDDVQ